MKRIIFDLDNTLIMWKSDYIKALSDTMKKYNIDGSADELSSVIDSYEAYYDYYDKESLMELINNNIMDKVDMNFINDFLINIGYMSDKDDDVIDTLEYLSKKYELVVLTNWFTEAQKNRLKNAGIFKYFKKIVGGEKCMKPQKEAFMSVIDDLEPKDCIMVGDDYNIDIVGAYNVGIEPIFVNNKNIENKNFKEIKNIKELKNIL